MQASALSIPDKYNIPEKTTQFVVVRYQGASKGKLTYYEKNKKGTWKKIMSCTAYLGARGIGKKKEGDKKTPTGLYSLGQAFGIYKNPGTKMPYVKVNRYHYWCADSGSQYYNQLIRTDKTGHRCRGEHLIDYKTVYNYGIFIEYNKAGKAGKGSAIFLHCSRKRATGGCVAIPEKQLKKLLKQLDPTACPKILIY
jgi:L,D-peptidoglycan transpeptidase YkuD (ErfK/YbiS/YcfS/YnhG family)